MTVRADILDFIERGRQMLKRKSALASAYKSRFDSDAEGRFVLADILKECGILEDQDAPADADTRSYKAGRRAIGIYILGRLRWSEGQILELAKRQTAEALENAATQTIVGGP